MTAEKPNHHPREAALYAMLDRLFMPYETVDHEAVFTVEESGTIKSHMPGGHTKNLFLKDKDGQFILICALAETVIRLNKLHTHIGTKRLSFGKPDALEEKLGVKPGSVTFFSVLNDEDRSVRLILDRALLDHEFVWFHPLRNTASTKIRSEHLIQFAYETGHQPMIIDFDAIQSQS